MAEVFSLNFDSLKKGCRVNKKINYCKVLKKKKKKRGGRERERLVTAGQGVIVSEEEQGW